MNLIVCVDDRYGMSFMNKRQSKDRLLRQDLLALVGDKPLWMHPYSAAQFEEPVPTLRVSRTCLTQAGAGDFVFCELELPSLPPEGLVIYRWNRHYPADRTFPSHWLEGKTPSAVTEFPGSSHDRITREVYVL